MTRTSRQTSKRAVAGLVLAAALAVPAVGGPQAGGARAGTRSSAVPAASPTAAPDRAPASGPDQAPDRATPGPEPAPDRATPGPEPAPDARPLASAPPVPSSTAPVPGAGMARGTPARVVIAAIGVDAPVVDLDRDAGGRLEAPDWEDVGWWRRGPEPGERGPAVIVGHVDSYTGPAVFARLHELQAGDVVDLALDGGGTASYVVDRSERFAKDAFPTRDVYALTGGPELRIITCDGEFDESTGHYVDNLVVFARPA